MGKMFINDTTLTEIADAIREKTGTTGGMLPGDMAELIAAISTGNTVLTGSFTPTSADTYTTPIEITGLGGEPTHVLVWWASGTGLTVSGSGSYYVFMSTINNMEINTNRNAYVGAWKASDNQRFIKLTTDGFTIQAPYESAVLHLSQYDYLAVL